MYGLRIQRHGDIMWHLVPQDEIRAFCAENAAGLNDALTFAGKSCCQWRLFCRKAI